MINRHPDVRMSLVRPKKNPITGSVVVADVVLGRAQRQATRTHANRRSRARSSSFAANSLTEWKVPVAVSFVQSLAMTEGGKLARLMRNVLVTGGSRGLGFGIVRRLAGSGYCAIAVARKMSESARRRDRASREQAAGLAAICRCDLSEIDDIPNLVKSMRKSSGRSTGSSTMQRLPTTARFRSCTIRRSSGWCV